MYDLSINLLVTLGKIDGETWKAVGWVTAIFAAIAVLIVVAILVVGKVFHVDTDEKVTKILENLAGANCGGCGCSGCSGFAAKLASGKGNLCDCHVTAQENKEEIARILGVTLEKEERTVAVVKCAGALANCEEKFAYAGNPTCADCATLLGGNKACKYGCLGCGDCAKVCSENGITVKDKLAKVYSPACLSCGACITACPKGVIDRVPASAKVYVACSSHDKGKEVMNACKTGCIACGLCAKKCPEQAITMVNNLPVIDYKKCVGCKVCVSACPKHTIVEMP